MTLAAAAVATLAVTGCGGPGKPAATAPKPSPTQACLQLQNFGLNNHGQGISKSFGRQLKQETSGTPAYADVVQWLNDLAAPAPRGSSAALAFIKQVAGDAAKVGSDCAGYGVRNVLGN